jgi:hypothetical protein
MTRIKQKENLRFSAFIRGEKRFCSSIAEFGVNLESEISRISEFRKMQKRKGPIWAFSLRLMFLLPPKKEH